MTVFFTSDLHLGHALAAEKRGFSTLAEHDDAVMHSLNGISKRDKLFIVGDAAFKRDRLPMLKSIPCPVELIFGNHDLGKAAEYLDVVHSLHGCRQYKHWWVTHIPIHPQELYRCKGNIHGHIHKDAATLPIEDPRYFNVNWDFHRAPVSFTRIDLSAGSG